LEVYRALDGPLRTGMVSRHGLHFVLKTSLTLFQAHGLEK
jgi:hypothetical protein